jgi:hypothetical protein
MTANELVTPSVNGACKISPFAFPTTFWLKSTFHLKTTYGVIFWWLELES